MDHATRARFLAAFFPRLDALEAGDVCGMSEDEARVAASDPIVRQATAFVLGAVLDDVAEHGARIGHPPPPARGSTMRIGFIYG